MDSVVRQSRHQFGAEKDVFMPRLCKNIISTFQHIYKCPPEDKVDLLKDQFNEEIVSNQHCKMLFLAVHKTAVFALEVQYSSKTPRLGFGPCIAD